MCKTITWLPTIILIALIAMGSVYGPAIIRIVGSTGNSAEVSEDGQLHVVMQGKIDTNNSTGTPLAGGATYTGTATDTSPYAALSILVEADQTGTLTIQFSEEGLTDWHDGETYSIPASTTKFFTPPIQSLYYRVKFVNDATPQTEFHLHTMLKKQPIKWSSHNLQDSLNDQDDATLNVSVLKLRTAANTYVSGTATSQGNFKVSLEELESGVSSNSNSQLNTTSFHADGTAGQLLTGIDYATGKSGIDSSTETLQTIMYEHHEIHAGNHYEICDVVDLPISNVFDIQFTTPNTSNETHLTYTVQTESETEIYIYEAATINVAGTTKTAFNNDRNSANTSDNTIASILNTSLALANADTDVSGATEILHQTIGAGRTSQGATDRGRELILKQNTVYCMRAVASAAGYVNYCMQWYEHTPKN